MDQVQKTKITEMLKNSHSRIAVGECPEGPDGTTIDCVHEETDSDVCARCYADVAVSSIETIVW